MYTNQRKKEINDEAQRKADRWLIVFAVSVFIILFSCMFFTGCLVQITTGGDQTILSTLGIAGMADAQGQTAATTGETSGVVRLKNEGAGMESNDALDTALDDLLSTETISAAVDAATKL